MALQQLMAEGFLGKGLVTNYEDTRDEATRALSDLDHIDGDILMRPTWERIVDWQRQNAPDGFALVLHRPYGALQDLRPGFYRGAIHLLMDMTKPNGMLLLQTPGDVGGLKRAVYLAALERSARDRDDVAELYTSPDYFDPITCTNYKGLVCITKTPE